MRDPDRISVFCSKLAKIWENVPDWRFGQLIVNFQRAYGCDLFFPEDDKFLKNLEDFINKYVHGDRD